MGSQKQLLRLDGKPILQHTLENAIASNVEEIVLVLGSAANEIQQQITPNAKVRIVINEAFADGMGTSLQTGIAALGPQSEAALVVLADQPLVKAATLNQLIDDYTKHKPQILIPLYRGFRGNPVLLDRSVFPEIAALKGDLGCRAIFGDHLENIRKLEVDDPGILLDADRPHDLDRLSQTYASGSLRVTPMESDGKSLSDAADLIIVGREGVAAELVKFARLLNLRVTVVDPLLKLADLPEANCVLHTMDFSLLTPVERRFCVVASMGRFDEEALEQAVSMQIPYIALVANKKRSQEVLQGLGLKGIRTDMLAGVRTKPGISIGAQTPAEIALSIAAEIVGELRRNSN